MKILYIILAIMGATLCIVNICAGNVLASIFNSVAAICWIACFVLEVNEDRF